MITIPTNTISKLYYFDNRIKSIYQDHGYTSIPFNREEALQMIDNTYADLSELFKKIWGDFMGAHLLDKYYSFSGNIFDLYMSLDSDNRHIFSNTDW